MPKKLTSTVDAHVGNRVRIARMEKGLSQEALAVAIGLSFQQVQKYEKGKNRIGCGRLQEIAQVVGRTPDWFFIGAPGSRPSPYACNGEADVLPAFGATRDGFALAQAYMAIEDVAMRAAVLAVARAAAGGRANAALVARAGTHGGDISSRPEQTA